MIIAPHFKNGLPIENGNVIGKIPAFLDVIELPFVLDKHIMLDTEGVNVLTGLIDSHPGFPGFAENKSSKKTAKHTKKFRGDRLGIYWEVFQIFSLKVVTLQKSNIAMEDGPP